MTAVDERAGKRRDLTIWRVVSATALVLAGAGAWAAVGEGFATWREALIWIFPIFAATAFVMVPRRHGAVGFRYANAALVVVLAAAALASPRGAQQVWDGLSNLRGGASSLLILLLAPYLPFGKIKPKKRPKRRPADG